MSSSSSSASSGIGFGGILFVVFLVLKLCHVINWSWWWVTAPLWGSIVLFLGIMLVVGLVMLVAAAFGSRRSVLR
jgi:hypothetical protein